MAKHGHYIAYLQLQPMCSIARNVKVLVPSRLFLAYSIIESFCFNNVESRVDIFFSLRTKVPVVKLELRKLGTCVRYREAQMDMRRTEFVRFRDVC
jgi:hypothetical protein